MKTIAGIAVLIFALAVSIRVLPSLRAASPQPAPAVAAQPVAAAAAAMPAEPHPEIRAAIAALRQAQHHLQHGAHDFGGHRAEALRLTDQALQQCRAALSYDRH